TYEKKGEIERFIDEQLEPLVEFAQSFAALLSSSLGKGDTTFLKLLEVWTRLRRRRDRYGDGYKPDLFFDRLGCELLTFSLWARSDLEAESVKAFQNKLTEEGSATAPTLLDIVSILSKRANLREIAGETAIRAKTLIEQEDEVSYRASLFARLARAILPASSEEATAYFRAGLEQMDAIGSGDYQFTNELLLFAAELQGDELAETDFHALTNICELNMSEETKFPWFAFARGLSRTSGCRTLAKLGRWHDRGKICFDYTLLPYVTALIEDCKIDPAVALAILRLSDPAELYGCGTGELATVIETKQFPNARELIAELIYQFESNNPGVPMAGTLATLSDLAARVLGNDSKESAYLSIAAPHFRRINDEENEHRNYRGRPDAGLLVKREHAERENKRALKKIIDETVPSDETSISHAIDLLSTMEQSFDLKSSFLESLREGVPFSERARYVQIIARLENLNIYAKLNELKVCKAKWSSSSTALGNVFRELGVPLVQIHADAFVNHDYFSGYNLKEIAELSGVGMATLA
ncbi:MAG: hypothetical protein MN733_33545, partial [Nitrososphaera sp.]|nr:hypothetical protein [Nitrososphaera sp.]